jgi:hypothetical protein
VVEYLMNRSRRLTSSYGLTGLGPWLPCHDAAAGATETGGKIDDPSFFLRDAKCDLGEEVSCGRLDQRVTAFLYIEPVRRRRPTGQGVESACIAKQTFLYFGRLLEKIDSALREAPE